LKHIAVLLLVGIYVWRALLPAWDKVQSAPSARDYATYHYAVKSAFDGKDPYETRQLNRMAKSDKTRNKVHPYFYPPPFLMAVAWAIPLKLSTAYQVFFWLNQLFLGAALWMMWRWFRVGWLPLTLILATFSPIPDNAWMGQANLLILVLAIWGLWRVRGGAIGCAAMGKMSPAIYLAWWASRGDWQPVLRAVRAVFWLTILAIPLVGVSSQVRFYTEVLPGFSSGNYHGLTVPINLPANHSIPDLFNQLWPGPDRHTLSDEARLSAAAVPLGDACVAGAMTVLLLMTPVYTYEHHLVLLLLPLGAVAAALKAGRLGWAWWAPLLIAYVGLAWPLSTLREAQSAWPDFTWILQESKTVGEVVLGLACTRAAAVSPRRGLLSAEHGGAQAAASK
jgi:hypothetical protein